MVRLVKILNRNPVFKYLSSVKLAVPLMIIVICSVAMGTIYESRYNADYAKLMVYSTTWFQVLECLLWINIFCSTISRIPYKKHHTGFVIVHIGLMTLLVGGLITGKTGIDGQLRIEEKSKENTVVLQDLVVGYALPGTTRFSVVKVKKGTSELSGSSLAFLNDVVEPSFTVEKLYPFAEIEKRYVEGGDGTVEEGGEGKVVGLGFTLKSPNFGKVKESLNSTEEPEKQMGPARLRLIVDKEIKKKTKKVSVEPIKFLELVAENTEFQASDSPKSNGPVLIIRKFGSDKILKTISISALQKNGVEIGPVKISLKKVFKMASVGPGGLIEGDKENPALEISLEHQGKTSREIAFAKFPSFSINKGGAFGLSFTYQVPGIVAQNSTGAGHGDAGEKTGENLAVAHSAEGGADAAGASAGAQSGTAPGGTVSGDHNGNVIEFHVTPGKKDAVRVELYKNGQNVLVEQVAIGSSIQTPWMGMTIYLDNLAFNSQAVNIASPTLPKSRMPLPPAAIFVRPGGAQAGQGSWVVEGDSKTFQTAHGPLTVYFGRDTLQLPFALELNKFSKIDYPGTETPMSYESEVTLVGTTQKYTISMNEPLKMDGFTVYQSSYDLRPGFPAASIFSVNRDPGRPAKYVGSIILVCGIAIFTLMRSRLARNKGIFT